MALLYNNDSGPCSVRCCAASLLFTLTCSCWQQLPAFKGEQRCHPAGTGIGCHGPCCKSKRWQGKKNNKQATNKQTNKNRPKANTVFAAFLMPQEQGGVWSQAPDLSSLLIRSNAQTHVFFCLSVMVTVAHSQPCPAQNAAG